MFKKIGNLMVIVICLISIIYCPKADAALLEGEQLCLSVTQAPIALGIIPSAESLEPIPGFYAVSDELLKEILYSGDITKWPPVIYIRNEDGRFFDSKTGILVGEFGHIEQMQNSHDLLVRFVTPTRTGLWMTPTALMETYQIGCLTTLVKNGKFDFAVIIISGKFDEGLMSNKGAIKYVVKDNKLRNKYIDLLISDLGWSRTFYQPISQLSE